MNPKWKNFLLSEGAVFEKNDRIIFSHNRPGKQHLYPLSHLSVLSVSGKDAAKLLQGQATCNIQEVNESQASIGAFCNPKGRAIATFIVAKKADDFLLILPLDLVEPIKARLQKYVLRSDVRFKDRTDDLCLFGVSLNERSNEPLFAVRPEHDALSIALGPAHSRHLMIADAASAIKLWSGLVAKQGYTPKNLEDWRLLELQDGIPWLTQATSEEYIPQMLNLDRLGGISFTKGCYTGQEIVARTHYLGKAKRALFLAECDLDAAPEPNAIILDKNSTEQSAGQVLTAISLDSICRMQTVLLVSENGDYDLVLKDRPEVTLRLLPFHYS